MTTADNIPTLAAVAAAVTETETHGRALLLREAEGLPTLAAVDGLRLAADRAQALAVRWATAADRAPSGLAKARRLSLRASRLRTLALRLRPKAAQAAALSRLGTVTTSR